MCKERKAAPTVDSRSESPGFCLDQNPNKGSGASQTANFNLKPLGGELVNLFEPQFSYLVNKSYSISLPQRVSEG